MKEHSRTEYSLLNIAAGLGGYVVSVIVSLINRMVFTRCLPPAYLGISGLFSNILSMLSLTELGVSGAIVFALYKPLAQNDKDKIASLVQVFGKAYRAIGLVIGGLGLCVLPFLELLIGKQPEIAESIQRIYIIYLFNTAGSYFFTYRSTLLVAAQKNYLVTGLNYLVLCVQEVIQAIFLFSTRNYIGYLLIQTGFSILYYVWISHIAVKQYPYIRQKNIQPLDSEEKKRLFKDMRDLMAYKVSGVLVNSTDNIIITFFNGLVTTGLASNYTLLTNTLSTLLNQVFNGLTASVGNLNAIESDEKKYAIFNVSNLLNFWLFSWGAVGIIFVSSDLVQFLFGEQYILNLSIPLILAINFYTVGMQNAIWTFKHTMGLFRYGRFLQLGTGALNLFFSVFLGQHWGLFGILFATFLSRLFTNLWYDPYVICKHAFGKNPIEYLKKYILYLLILMIEVLICLCFTMPLHFSLITNIVLKSILISLICNAVFFLLFHRTPEFQFLLRSLSKIRSLVVHIYQKQNRRI